MSHDEWVASGRCPAVHDVHGWCMEWVRHRAHHSTERVDAVPGEQRLFYWVDDSVFPPDESKTTR